MNEFSIYKNNVVNRARRRQSDTVDARTKFNIALMTVMIFVVGFAAGLYVAAAITAGSK